EGQHHRRVVPGDQRSPNRRDVGVEKTHERGLARVLRHALRQMGDDDMDIRRVRGLADLQVRGLSRPDFDRFLPEDDVHGARKPAHQVLRPLEDEVPPQVRKAKESCDFRFRRRGLGIQLYWHPDASQHFSFNLHVVNYPRDERAEGHYGSESLIEINGNLLLLHCSKRQCARLTGRTPRGRSISRKASLARGGCWTEENARWRRRSKSSKSGVSWRGSAAVKSASRRSIRRVG